MTSGTTVVADDRVASLRTRVIDVPLVRPWGPDVTGLHLIEVVVTTTSGAVGRGFSWTPSIGAHAVAALLDHDIRDAVLGKTANPQELWPALWAHVHEAGSGGLTTIAMAGLDLALWDAAARASERSITQLLGARRESVSVYGSGVNLHYPIEELVAQAQRWVAAGYDMVKVKVGRPELGEDIDRIAAVREAIGPDRGLAIDANQRWNLETAERAIGALSRFDLRWIEEPLLSDDLAGYAALRSRIDVAVAIGENLHTIHRFREAIDGGACDIVQPNVVRVGGITPFLTIARLADERDIPLYPHLLPELSGQLALALERPTMVEDVEDSAFERLGILVEPAPVVISDGTLTSRNRPGLGLTFGPTTESKGHDS